MVTKPSEMFLRECKLNGIGTRLLRRLLDRPGQHSRSTEVRANGRLELGLASWKIRSAVNGFPHLAEDRLPIRPSEHGATAKESERVVVRPSVVDSDVP